MSGHRLQPLTRAKVAALGDVGAAWLAGLPAALDDLERRWSIRVGATLPGGSTSYVARVERAGGSPAVLKIAVTAEGLDDQAAILRRAGGRGYARLLGYDPMLHALLLLEELGDPLERSGRTPEDQLRLLADTLLLAWQDPEGRRPPPGGDKASGLHALIRDLWPRLGRPCSERVVEQALSFAERRRDEVTEVVVVHGDPHPGNLLRVPDPRPGADTGYCFVDPDGFVADPAYDLGVALRDWSGRLDGSDARRVLGGYCQLLADRTGIDAVRIWEWGFVERVSTGLYVASFGAESVAAPFLRTAEALV